MISGRELTLDVLDALVEYVKKDSIVVESPTVWHRCYPIPTQAEELENDFNKGLGLREYVIQRKVESGHVGTAYFKTFDDAVVVVNYETK